MQRPLLLEIESAAGKADDLRLDFECSSRAIGLKHRDHPRAGIDEFRLQALMSSAQMPELERAEVRGFARFDSERHALPEEDQGARAESRPCRAGRA